MSLSVLISFLLVLKISFVFSSKVKSLNIVLFQKGSLRIHDNPCLQYVEDNQLESVVPICINNDSDSNNGFMSKSVDNLRNDIESKGGDLISVASSDFQTFISKIASSSSPSSKLKLLYMTNTINDNNNFQTTLQNTLKVLSLDTQNNIEVISLPEYTLVSDTSSSSASLIFNAKQYASVPQPKMRYKLKYDTLESLTTDHDDNVKSTTTAISPAIKSKSTAYTISGIELLKEYIALGEIEFSRKYTNDYIHSISSSTQVDSRGSSYVSISSSISQVMDLRVDTNASLERIRRVLFQGEVISGLISPHLEYGTVSPRLLVHARSVLFENTNLYLKQLSYERPLIDRLKLEAVRKDWHKLLAIAAAASSKSNNISSKNSVNHHDLWDIQFRYWKGFIQREGRMYSKSSSKSGNTAINNKVVNNGNNFAPSSLFQLPPLVVLIHGFGGSLNQFSVLAKELSTGDIGECCDVLAIDSLGFGQSEKPPLSYNQYIWRDQIVDALSSVNTHDESIKSHGHSAHNEKRRVVLAGNSIGGFTAASVAAAMSHNGLSSHNGVEIVGLVLFNSAGKIDSPLNKAMTSYSSAVSLSSFSPSSLLDTLPSSSSTSAASFPPYKGPAPQLLRAVGKIIFSLLQPRIRSLCEWLYPTRPQAVAENQVAETIYRDSEDPGAHDVIAAGGKLPPPTTMNVLLRDEYTRPVLICQGALDPLNDAKSRAALFQTIRGRSVGSGISDNNSDVANGGITVDLLQLGHCPMDEDGRQVSNSMKKWMEANQIL